MAHPYKMRGKELDLESGTRAPVVFAAYKPPKPPIRMKTLPRVLFPFLKQGG